MPTQTEAAPDPQVLQHFRSTHHCSVASSCEPALACTALCPGLEEGAARHLGCLLGQNIHTEDHTIAHTHTQNHTTTHRHRGPCYSTHKKTQNHATQHTHRTTLQYTHTHTEGPHCSTHRGSCYSTRTHRGDHIVAHTAPPYTAFLSLTTDPWGHLGTSM